MQTTAASDGGHGGRRAPPSPGAQPRPREDEQQPEGERAVEGVPARHRPAELGGRRRRRTAAGRGAPAASAPPRHADPTSIVAATTSAVRRRPSRHASRQPTATSARIVQGCIATATTSPRVDQPRVGAGRGARRRRGWRRRARTPSRTAVDDPASSARSVRPRDRAASARGPAPRRGRRRACASTVESPTASTRTSSAPGSTRTSSRGRLADRVAVELGLQRGLHRHAASRRSRQCSTRWWPRRWRVSTWPATAAQPTTPCGAIETTSRMPSSSSASGISTRPPRSLPQLPMTTVRTRREITSSSSTFIRHPRPVAVELGQARDHVRHRPDLGLEALRGVGHDLGVEAEARHHQEGALVAVVDRHPADVDRHGRRR